MFGFASAEEIAGWGQVDDPDGDCAIAEENGKVTITVPATVHDLWFGHKSAAYRFNAPRVWQEVTGDFTAEVKVTFDWNLGERLPEGTLFAGAGLIAWQTPDHYLRHERGAFVPSDPAAKGQALAWTGPLYDREAKRISPWKTSPAKSFVPGPSTWLRMERTGQKIVTSISHDGQKWTQTGAVATRFPRTIQLGIEAISGNGNGLTAEFEDFAIVKK
jgi:regulation of enolase protein 1 (concanavalin A-like superfamily)